MAGASAHTTTGGMQSTELGIPDSNDEKQFRKYILRRNYDESVEDSRENFSRKNSITKKAVMGYSKQPSKKLSGFNNYIHLSPRKSSEGSVTTKSPSKSESILFTRPQVRALGRSIIYGDKLNKKQTKTTHPLNIFVGTSNPG